jgi:hypothetical protein
VRAQNDFQICGLYKFWAIKGMRAQVRLIQTLINYWDLETESFNLDRKPLRIEGDDIYFIIRLYFRGEVVNIKS